MRSTLFYIIVTLFATTQGVVVRSPDIAADNELCQSTFQYCELRLSVSPRTVVAYSLQVFP